MPCHVLGRLYASDNGTFMQEEIQQRAIAKCLSQSPRLNRGSRWRSQGKERSLEQRGSPLSIDHTSHPSLSGTAPFGTLPRRQPLPIGPLGPDPAQLN